MTTHRTIAATETDPQAPLVSALFKALANNLIAAFEGDATAVAAGVTLKDPALDTGAATAAGTAWVGLRTAGLAVGAVGSYAFATLSTPANQNQGFTTAGSNLVYINAAGANPGGTLSGTWRLMGRTAVGSAQASSSLWLRIS